MESPKAPIVERKSRANSAIIFEITYEYGWVPRANASPQSYDPITTNGYYDASIPCSYTFSFTYCSDTLGGEVKHESN